MFLYFLKKAVLIFQEIELCYIFKIVSKKTSYLSAGNFISSKNKKNPLKTFLIFLEIDFLGPSLKTSLFKKSILIFQDVTCKAWKKFLYFGKELSSMINTNVFFSLTTYLQSPKNTWGDNIFYLNNIYL